MKTALFKLGQNDVVKAIAIAVIGTFLGALQSALTTNGLDVASYDWAEIFKVTGSAVIIYLTKNFFTAQNGLILGKI